MTKKTAAIALLALALLVAGPASAFAQQPRAASPDGFVPVDPSTVQEHLPAAPLVMGAYSVAWVAIFGYMWSIWRRLERLERDLASVSRRVEAGSRR